MCACDQRRLQDAPHPSGSVIALRQTSTIKNRISVISFWRCGRCLMSFDDRVPFGRSVTWERGFSRFYPPKGSTPCLLLPDLIVKFLQNDALVVGRSDLIQVVLATLARQRDAETPLYLHLCARFTLGRRRDQQVGAGGLGGCLDPAGHIHRIADRSHTLLAGRAVHHLASMAADTNPHASAIQRLDVRGEPLDRF